MLCMQSIDWLNWKSELLLKIKSSQTAALLNIICELSQQLATLSYTIKDIVAAKALL